MIGKNELKIRIDVNIFENFIYMVLWKIAYNVSGIAEGGEIEAESFDFAPRRAKTNYYELNLKIKNE